MVRQFFLAALTVSLLSSYLAESATAQVNTFRRHRTLRWLGQGFSDGYHRCTPGYDSSHYNPYSMHNSFLYSQTPAYRQLQGTQNYAMNPHGKIQFFTGVPFSVYAAPPSMDLPHPVPRHSADDADQQAGDDDLEVSFEPTPNFFKDGNSGHGSGFVRDQPADSSPFQPDAKTDRQRVIDSPPVPQGVPVNSDNPPSGNEAPAADSDSLPKATFRLPVLNGTGIDPEKHRTFQQTGFQK